MCGSPILRQGSIVVWSYLFSHVSAVFDTFNCLSLAKLYISQSPFPLFSMSHQPPTFPYLPLGQNLGRGGEEKMRFSQFPSSHLTQPDRRLPLEPVSLPSTPTRFPTPPLSSGFFFSREMTAERNERDEEEGVAKVGRGGKTEQRES